jgi:hypothetical protein
MTLIHNSRTVPVNAHLKANNRLESLKGKSFNKIVALSVPQKCTMLDICVLIGCRTFFHATFFLP